VVDLEFIAKRALRQGCSYARRKLIEEYMFSKGFTKELASKFADAVLAEIRLSESPAKNMLVQKVLSTEGSGVAAGVFGVGSRGAGDILVHDLIARTAHSANANSSVNVVIDPLDHDDAGAVEWEGLTLFCSVDGAHSRLSNFPFLMGFHDARAALRDVCAKGAVPVALVDDVHLADDGDVSKILEFVAGVSAVSEITGVPLVAGSTLRVGGDMVLGDRLVGAVAAFGVTKGAYDSKKNVKPGDVVIMTEGAGGGTVCTAAIYSGNSDVVFETLNLDFFFALKALREKGALKLAHAITDVTNGGVRGDLEVMSKKSGVRITVEREALLSMVNAKVLELLTKLKIDPLGLSLDSLLLFVPRENAEAVLSALPVKSKVVGVVDKGEGCFIREKDGTISELKPKFRESAYTGLKKLVGEEAPPDRAVLEKAIEAAWRRITEKKELAVSAVRRRYSGSLSMSAPRFQGDAT